MSEPASMEWLLPGVQAKGNGFVVGTVTEDGRVVPFSILPVVFGRARRDEKPRSRP